MAGDNWPRIRSRSNRAARRHPEIRGSRGSTAFIRPPIRYCHVTPTVHCSDEAGQQFLLDQQSSHSMDRHAFLPPLGSFERQRVNQDRRTSNDEDTMCCICFPRPPLVAFMKTTPLFRRHHRQTTSNFGDFLDGFLSGTHLVVEVQHVLLRL